MKNKFLKTALLCFAIAGIISAGASAQNLTATASQTVSIVVPPSISVSLGQSALSASTANPNYQDGISSIVFQDFITINTNCNVKLYVSATDFTGQTTLSTIALSGSAANTNYDGTPGNGPQYIAPLMLIGYNGSNGFSLSQTNVTTSKQLISTITPSTASYPINYWLPTQFFSTKAPDTYVSTVTWEIDQI